MEQIFDVPIPRYHNRRLYITYSYISYIDTILKTADIKAVKFLLLGIDKYCCGIAAYMHLVTCI